MKCEACDNDKAKPIYDYLESQGGKYIAGFYCEECLNKW